MKNPDWKWPLILSLTLGLAPFVPEPHLWGKLQWIAGGAVGMQPMDWLDVVQHGAPWIWLAVVLVLRLRYRLQHQAQADPSPGTPADRAHR